MEHSPIGTLSAELRNHIYSYLFDSRYAVPLADGKTQHPLCQTSRLLRYETIKMYYANTRFNAHLDDGPSTRLIEWLSRIDRDMIIAIPEISLWDLHNLILQIYTSTTASVLPPLIQKRLNNEWQDKIVGGQGIVPREKQEWFRATYGFEYRMVPISRNMTFNRYVDGLLSMLRSKGLDLLQLQAYRSDCSRYRSEFVIVPQENGIDTGHDT